MDPLLWKIGRVGWARSWAVEIAGWRRRFWRIWTRVGPADAPFGSSADREAGSIARILHWLPGINRPPICGGDPRHCHGTRELEHVSCPRCRDIGISITMQYQANTR